MKARIIILLLSLVIGGLCACNYLAEAYHDIDAPGPPVPVLQQMNCDSPLVEITEPKFISGYVEIDDPLTSNPVLVVGPYFDTIHPNELDQLAIKFDSLLTLLDDNYDYEVYVNADDNRNIAVIVPGTNERSAWALSRDADWKEVRTADNTRGWINSKVYMEVLGRRWFFVWAIQGFYFGGALTYDEYMAAVEKYQSMRGFNFRDCDWTQGQCDTMSLKIKGCNKKGREFADFKFGNTSDSIPPLFVIAKWDKVRP